MSIKHLTLCVCLTLFPALAYAQTTTTPTPDLKLPANWFTQAIVEHTGPAVLTKPIEEKWRVAASHAILHGDRALLITGGNSAKATLLLLTPEAQKNPQATFEQMQRINRESTYVLECRDAHSDRVIWTRQLGTGMPNAPRIGVWVDHFATVGLPPRNPAPAGSATSQPQSEPAETWLVDTQTGEVIRRYTPPKIETKDRSAPASPLGTDPKTLWRNMMLADPDLLAAYSGTDKPAPPTGGDKGEWPEQDMQRLTNILNAPFIPHSGAIPRLQGSLLLPNGDFFWADALHGLLCRTQLESGTSVWQTPFLNLQPQGLLWHPPLLVAFSSPCGITAYDEKTGRPLWTYEWPEALPQNYTWAMAALTDGILLLTDPQVPRPATMRKFQSGYGTDWNARSCLTKLDMQGHVLFRQELPALLGYGRMSVSNNAILLWGAPGFTSDTVICLAPADPAHPTSRPAPDPARIQGLLANYEKADPRERLEICTDLARLGDTSIVDRVLADLEAANRNLQTKVQCGPLSQNLPTDELGRLAQFEDRDRTSYIQALAVLKDRKAIPALLPLWEARWLRKDVKEAILAITDGEPLKDDVYRAWRDRSIAELHARYEQARSSEQQASARIADEPSPQERLRAMSQRMQEAKTPEERHQLMQERMQARRERGNASRQRALAGVDQADIATQLADLDDPGFLDLLVADLNRVRAQSRPAPTTPMGMQSDMRGDYIRRIGALRDKRIIPILTPFLDDPDPMVRMEANQALNRMFGPALVTPMKLRLWWQAHKHLYEQPATQPSSQ